ncbi:zinc dependent phospholipase C family protein [Pseudomonas sp. SWRI153]|uniref:Zinc dependent phospholipase C family protein n=1 Tax=Pseudomonas khorasanensis TaxID=2745508 RepID=A0A923JH39_9PSED|nr:zinc dependent phospholipase C family protein [Pseudomonas khorasanensis]MBV4488143.1 zinc dependent phospholipase C family protein [Pseudomonas khorasanensis]
MPGVFTHFLTMRAIKDSLAPELKQLMDDFPEHAHFGSVGPDYLYFYKNDWGPAGQVGHLWFSLIDELKDVVGLYNTAVSAQNNVEDWLTGGLASALQANVELIKGTISADIAKLATSNIDFFEVFAPPIASKPYEADIINWWWADIAHQHRTTEFARCLWEKSEGNPAFRAYTLGYLTHMATDIVGHPYINLIAGGPYRNHWRRHNFVERIYDTHFWKKQKGENLLESACHKLVHFAGYYPDQPEIPKNLCDFLSECYQETYKTLNISSGIPTSGDVNEMYQIYYKYLLGATDNSLLNLPKPPDDFDWFDLDVWIQQKLKSVLDRQPNLGRAPTIRIDDPKSWKSFLAGLLSYLIWLAELATMIATILVAVAARIATTPARYLLWKLSLVLYQLYDMSRLALVMAGYVHPTPDQVDKYFGGITSPDYNTFQEVGTPFLHITNVEQTYHLVHPYSMDYGSSVRLESPRCRIMKNHVEYGDATNLFFGKKISGITSNDVAGLCTYQDMPIASIPEFGALLCNQFQINRGVFLPNFNLDGDRGYAWPTWIARDPKPWSTASFVFCP